MAISTSFFIQDRNMPVGIGRLAQALVPNPTPERVKRFIDLNAHLGRYAQYDSVIIVASDYGPELSYGSFQSIRRDVQQLQSLKAALNPAQQRVITENWVLLSTALNVGSSAVGGAHQLIKAETHVLSELLNQLENAAQETLKRKGTLKDPAFQQQQQAILRQIDTVFRRMLMRRSGIPQHMKLSTALQLSAKTIHYRWDLNLPAVYVRQYDKLKRWIKGTDGRLGKAVIAISAGKAAYDVYQACADDLASKECSMGVGGTGFEYGFGALAGVVGGAVAKRICVFISPHPVFGLACNVAIVGASLAGNIGGGMVGKEIGQAIGDKVYDGIRK